jgi:hypothetical protein
MEKKIDYSFTAIPTNFIYIMDSDCLKAFTILIQKHTYWFNKGKLDNGYFVKSIDELQQEMHMKNQKDVRCVIQALVNEDLIDVIAIDGKRNTAKFKLNEERIKELANENLYDLVESSYYIQKLKRTEPITYYQQNVPLTNTEKNNEIQNVDNLLTKCTPTIDNINNIYNNKNNNIIYNKEINNIKEKDNIIIKEIKKDNIKISWIDELIKEQSNNKRKNKELTYIPMEEEFDEYEDKWLDSFIPSSIF